MDPRLSQPVCSHLCLYGVIKGHVLASCVNIAESEYLIINDVSPDLIQVLLLIGHYRLINMMLKTEGFLIAYTTEMNNFTHTILLVCSPVRSSDECGFYPKMAGGLGLKLTQSTIKNG